MPNNDIITTILCNYYIMELEQSEIEKQLRTAVFNGDLNTIKCYMDSHQQYIFDTISYIAINRCH